MTGEGRTKVCTKCGHEKPGGTTRPIQSTWRRSTSGYHVDHVTPLALEGSDGPENIVLACSHCNQSKGAKHPMDFAGVMC
jgi:5-methylcytosine-specific restriction endonuclease McrA